MLMYYFKNVVCIFQIYQKFEQLKFGFIVESFGGVDKKEDYKFIKGQWIYIYRDDINWSEEVCQKVQVL